jgi:hypothetical protein
VQFHLKLLNDTPTIPAPNHPPGIGFVSPIMVQIEPLFQVAIGIPRPERAAPDIGALHSYVPPLLKVRVAVLAPVIGVVLATAQRKKPVMALVAPVIVSTFVPISKRALLLMVSRLLTVTATEAVTFAAVFDTVRFLNEAGLIKILCPLVPLKLTMLPVRVVTPALGV